MSGTLTFSLAASGDKSKRKFGWAGGQLVCTEGPPPGKEVNLYFDGNDRPYKLRKALEYRREFKSFRIENLTGEALEFELQISEPGNQVVDRSYVGQNLSLEGDLYVPGSSSIDEGGAVRQLGTSRANIAIDQTGLGDGGVVIIDPASNLNGIRVRSIKLMIWTITSNAPRQITYKPNEWRHRWEYLKTTDSNSHRYYEECFDLPSGKGLSFDARDGDIITVDIMYDIF